MFSITLQCLCIRNTGQANLFMPTQGHTTGMFRPFFVTFYDMYYGVSLVRTKSWSISRRTSSLIIMSGRNMAAPAASRWSAVRYLHKSSRKEMRQTAWPIRWCSVSSGTICRYITSSTYLPGLMSICKSANGRWGGHCQRGSDATG